MLLLAGVTKDPDKARRLLWESLRTKRALEKFRQLVEAQGGDANVIEDLTLLPQASFTRDILAPADGYVQAIDPLTIGLTAMELGAGREDKDSVIDLAVGLELHAQVGDYVQKGFSLAKVFGNDPKSLETALLHARQAFTIGADKPSVPPTIYGKITAQDV